MLAYGTDIESTFTGTASVAFEIAFAILPVHIIATLGHTSSPVAFLLIWLDLQHSSLVTSGCKGAW